MRTRPASSRLPGILAALALAALSTPPQALPAAPARVPTPGGKVVFTDITEAAGIRFRHDAGQTPTKYMIEDMGSGVCFFDYDGDGDQDIYFVQSGPVPGTPGPRPTSILYRNDGKGHFTDVTAQAGVGNIGGYGMGCAVADIDNDGDEDLYVTNFGGTVLYRNNGNGTFTDITKKAGVRDGLWSESASFADYDTDGYVDLYVTNYVDFTMDTPKWCGDHIRKIRTYCHPDAYEGVPDILYHNNGDGTFTDVTKKAGITERWGKGLGVIWSDFDNDGDLDLYVAKDAVPHAMYRNNGNGTFTDVTLESGTGYSEDGRPESGMGTDSGDYDGDGLFDLISCHLSGEPNELYRNLGNMKFEVATFTSGFGEISIPFVGFGCQFLDFDNDGDLDIYVANGHIIDNIKLINDSLSWAQRPFLFENQGNGKFLEVARDHGAVFSREFVGRGQASADIDGDGDLDIVQNNNNHAALLLRNDGGNSRHYLRLKLTGTRSNRDAIGARVTVTAGGRKQVREARSASSYCSQSEMVLHFGLGGSTKADKVEIRWPAGTVQVLTDVKADQVLAVKEPSGAPGRPRP